MESVLVIFFSLLVVSASAAGPKLCVPKGISCTDVGNLNLNISCTTIDDDSSSCAAMVANGDADLGLATADDLVANVKKVKLVLAEKYANVADFVRYYGVAVVKSGSTLKLKELKGKKTCHTGVGKTAGWKIPIGYFLRTKVMHRVKDQYQSAASFFQKSCVPGIKDKVTDNSITDKLCSLCKDNCKFNSPYAGYDGAYMCMTSGTGEVAFVKHSTPTNKTNKLLCRDGSQKGVDDYEKCYIDKRPAGAFVTGSGKSADAVNTYRKVLRAAKLSDLINVKIVGKEVVGLNDTSQSPTDYLGDYLKDIQALNKVDTSGPKLCVPKGISCTDVGNLNLNISCTTIDDDSSSCAAMVANGDADLGLATADDLVANVKKVKLVLAEKYANVADFVRYYGVAVVKSGTTLKLKELKGKKTCHTGVGKTAGWKIPIGYFLRTKVMPRVKDQYQSAASFFQKSCVPGIKDKVTDNSITDKLCSLCKDNCTFSSPYAGYVGAYMCMTSGTGEVAFVKHSTPTDKTNKLLCRNGTQKGVDDYKNCYIDKRPAGAFVTGSGKSADAVNMYRDVLRAANLSDLIKVEIVGKEVVGLNDTSQSPTDYLGDYLKDIQALNKVDTSGGSSIAACLFLQLLAAFYLFVF